MAFPKNVERALKDRFLLIDERKNEVTYLPQGKTRVWSNPEEEVQIETYCNLIYDYGYPPEKLRVSDKVKIGSSTREADIMVYFDWEAKDPFIAVECKKRNISDEVFEEAIDQGFSYAAPTDAEYVWATSGDRNAYFEVIPDAFYERQLNQLRDIPRHDGKRRRAPRLMRKVKHLIKLPATSDSLLFSLVLTLAFAGLSFWATIKNDALMESTARLWAERGMNYSWVYQAIAIGAIGISLLFGMVFMRSHEFFEIPKARRGLTYTLLALMLFAPVWYIGSRYLPSDFWSADAFEVRKVKTFTYLWPFTLALPIQMVSIFVVVWLLKLGDQRKSARKK